ncbi:hypothetical protein JZ751_020514 [Albula glossodonta]|uniref:Uncharacterized protein n=1 Tax=Albula glossodonta TaxID=121402 RepID=A0A8T2PLA1_9TELE|nr:hypothetical protein JZ751_020514 [Albula glossodonta]
MVLLGSRPHVGFLPRMHLLPAWSCKFPSLSVIGFNQEQPNGGRALRIAKDCETHSMLYGIMFIPFASGKENKRMRECGLLFFEPSTERNLPESSRSYIQTDCVEQKTPVI